MAVNYTTKYSPLISSRFSLASLTDKYAGKKYEFDGAQSVVVYTIDKVELSDYNRMAASSRFGEVSELGDTKQTLTLTQDKSFTFSIDNGINSDQLNVKHCNEQLKSNWDEVCTPAIDMYRLNKWANGAGITAAGPMLTKANAMETIMQAGAEMNNLLVPKKNRAIFISESAYIATKLSSEIMGVDTLGASAVTNGVVGKLDGMDIVTVPDVYFPEGVLFMIKHKDATADPMKLKTLRVQKNPPGIDGDIGECRFYHDSFVLDSKINGIYVYGLTGSVVKTPEITVTAGSAAVTCATAGATIKYTTDGSNPKSSESALSYTAPVTVGAGDILKACAVKDGLVSSGVMTASA